MLSFQQASPQDSGSAPVSGRLEQLLLGARKSSGANAAAAEPVPAPPVSNETKHLQALLMGSSQPQQAPPSPAAPAAKKPLLPTPETLFAKPPTESQQLASLLTNAGSRASTSSAGSAGPGAASPASPAWNASVLPKAGAGGPATTAAPAAVPSQATADPAALARMSFLKSAPGQVQQALGAHSSPVAGAGSPGGAPNTASVQASVPAVRAAVEHAIPPTLERINTAHSRRHAAQVAQAGPEVPALQPLTKVQLQKMLLAMLKSDPALVDAVYRQYLGAFNARR